MPYRTLDNVIDGAVLTFTNITPIKKLEQSLMDSDSSWRTVFESLPVLVMAFDQQAHVVAWNKECERVTGYPAEQIIGKPDIFRRIFPDQELLSSPAPAPRSIRLVAKDGEVKTVRWIVIVGKTPVRTWARWAIGIEERPAAATTNA